MHTLRILLLTLALLGMSGAAQAARKLRLNQPPVVADLPISEPLERPTGGRGTLRVVNHTVRDVIVYLAGPDDLSVYHRVNNELADSSGSVPELPPGRYRVAVMFKENEGAGMFNWGPRDFKIKGKRKVTFKLKPGR